MVQILSEWILVNDTLDEAQSVISLSFSEEDSSDTSSLCAFKSDGKANRMDFECIEFASSLQMCMLVGSYLQSFSKILELLCTSMHILNPTPRLIWGCWCPDERREKYWILPALEKVASVRLKAGRVVGSLFKPEINSIPLTQRLGLCDGRFSHSR